MGRVARRRKRRQKQMHISEEKKKTVEIDSKMHVEEENIESVLGAQKSACNNHSQSNGYKYSNVIVAIATVLLVMMHQTAEASPNKDVQPQVKINKCCEKFEIYVNYRCTIAREANETEWTPTFTGYEGQPNVKVSEYKYLIGRPDCGNMQMWEVYHEPQNHDYLFLFPDGKLGHYVKNHRVEYQEEDDDISEMLTHRTRSNLYYDFEQGHYCLEKSVVLLNNTRETRQFAFACSQKVQSWIDADFLLKKVLNPIFHFLSMIIFLIIAIIYFVLPTLRDLVGNIMTTITICLIVCQAADLVRIFTEFNSHVSFLVADIVLYASMLGAFFWLNSMGYYIWKTFRSRNVFLRVTDGRKYCWYSGYAWGTTLLLSALAVFAHFFLDTGTVKEQYLLEDQEIMGWLGMAVFFTPIAFTVIINLFFYVTTLKVMNRINSYGRIHQKLKSNFIMFTLIFLTMSVTWIFFVLSWLKYDFLLYIHIITNFLQAPVIFYICIIREKHVGFLLKKTCCYNEPVTHASAPDWNYGDELTYMNGNY